VYLPLLLKTSGRSCVIHGIVQKFRRTICDVRLNQHQCSAKRNKCEDLRFESECYMYFKKRVSAGPKEQFLSALKAELFWTV
jgi:hypothetical protein